MKRVFRSCLDPLPRFLSTRTLAFVVVVVVFGTALSVSEYVQSGSEPERTWPQSAVRAAGQSPSTGIVRPTALQPERCAAQSSELGVQVEAARPRAEGAAKPATLYRPDDHDATGS